MRVECWVRDEKLCLSQAQITQLFQTALQSITCCLTAILSESDLYGAATCKYYLIVRLARSSAFSAKMVPLPAPCMPLRRTVAA